MARKVGGLSEDVVKALPAPEKGNRVVYFAGQTLQGKVAPRGFGVRVTAGGVRSFVINYRIGPVERRHTIGQWPDWSVVRAIEEARKLRQKIDSGADPAADRRAKRVAPPAEKSVNDVLDEFLKQHVKGKLRTEALIESALGRLVRPEIGKVAIYSLRRSMVATMLDKAEEAAGPVAADRALSYVRKAFNWFAARDDRFVPPIAPGMARTSPRDRARSRILDDTEIRDLWAALGALAAEPRLTRGGKTRPANPFPAFVRTLLLTGQRRDEVAHMQWGELGGDAWTVPAERYKTKEPHLVPLTPAALALIGKKAAGAGRYVFTTTGGKRPMTGYSKAKAGLDSKLAEMREAAERDAMPAWVLHDLRRTARSLMSRAGVASDIAERVLGHSLSGVRRTYDRHAYAAEKRAALEALAALVERILHQAENVAQMKSAASG